MSACVNNLLCIWLIVGVAIAAVTDYNKGGNGTGAVLWAAPGGEAQLGCDLTPSSVDGDAIGMVLWFKDDVRMPLYTVDFRNGPPVHWAVADDLGGRSHFVMNEARPELAHLAITKVSGKDEGVYRCRIDFVNSPTKNYKVNLTVVVPPEEPRIYDSEGKELVGTTAGPYREGDNLLLSCQVTGGRPRPDVTWWRGGQRLDSLVDVSSRGAVVSQLYLTDLARNYSGARLRCRASFSPLVPDLTREVVLKVYLKPKSVHVKTDGAVRAGREHNYVCTTRGSKPGPNIDWFLHSQRIDSANTQTEVSGDQTSSVLTWRARREDDAQTLVCRVSNPWFPAHTLQDSIVLDVLYPPVTSLVLDSPQDLRSLREDEEAMLVCSVDAKPPPHLITFYKDGKQMHDDPVAGVETSGGRLHLRDLRRHHSAKYSCSAANSEGEASSSLLQLDVLYRPECGTGGVIQQVTGAPGGVVRARCSVQAPPPRAAGLLRFYWTYNATRDVLPIPASNITITGSSSVAEHGVSADFSTSDADLGWLACWASNDIGNQREPCLFRIVPAALPDPPVNCELYDNSIELRCEPGHDGGLPQHFVLEVLGMASYPTLPNLDADGEISTMNDQGVSSRPTSEAVYKASNNSPEFSLDALAPGRYTLLVYSETPRGRSRRPAALHSVMVRSIAGLDRPGPLQTLTPGPPVPSPPVADNSLALVIGGVLALILLSLLTTLCVSLVVMCKKRSPRRYREEERRSVGVSMYSGGCGPATLIPTVAVRGNARNSRLLAARWSGLLDDAPLAVLALTHQPHDNNSESSFSEEQNETEINLH